MSTITLTYPNVIGSRSSLPFKLLLLTIISILIAGAILVIVSSRNTAPSNRTPVSQNLITPIAVPVPTPPIADIQPISSETPTPFSGETSKPSVVAVPVPTP